MQQLTNTQLSAVAAGAGYGTTQPFPPLTPLSPVEARELFKAALATTLITGAYILVDELIS